MSMLPVAELTTLSASWEAVFEAEGIETEDVPGGVAGCPALVVGAGPAPLLVVIGAGLSVSELSSWYEQAVQSCLSADGWDHDVLVVGAKAMVELDLGPASPPEGPELAAGWYGLFKGAGWDWRPGWWVRCGRCGSLAVLPRESARACLPCRHPAKGHGPSGLSDAMLAGGWEAYSVASVASCHDRPKLVGLPSLPVGGVGTDAVAAKVSTDWAERLVEAVLGYFNCIALVKDVCNELSERTGLEPGHIESVLEAWGHDGLLRINGPVVAICPSKVGHRRARAVFSARTAGAGPLVDA